MNKHQYALDNIGSTYFSMNYVANEKLRLEFEKMYNEYKQTLQELVDRATPKKPLNIWYGLTEQVGNCPNCDKKLFESVMELAYSKDDDLEYFKEVKLSNCNRCGQAIDWSNNES